MHLYNIYIFSLHCYYSSQLYTKFISIKYVENHSTLISRCFFTMNNNKIEYCVILIGERKTCDIYIYISSYLPDPKTFVICISFLPFPSSSVLTGKHPVYKPSSLFTRYIPVTGGSRDWTSRGRGSSAGIRGTSHG